MDIQRIMILGAGFSVPAGLPTASELFMLVRNRIRIKVGEYNSFERDLRYFLEYLKRTNRSSEADQEMSLESFL